MIRVAVVAFSRGGIRRLRLVSAAAAAGETQGRGQNGGEEEKGFCLHGWDVRAETVGSKLRSQSAELRQPGGEPSNKTGAFIPGRI